MDKEKKTDHVNEFHITNNFNARVGQNINHVDTVEVHMGKDSTMHITSAEQMLVEPDVPIVWHKDVDKCIKEVSSRINTGRLWFAVYRAMTEKGWVTLKDYSGFCMDVARLLPDHSCLPTAKGISDIDVDCFSKSIEKWSKSDAPVNNSATFAAYKGIGERLLRELPNADE